MKKSIILCLLLANSAFAGFQTIEATGQGEGSDIYEAKRFAYQSAEYRAEDKCSYMSGYLDQGSVFIVQTRCDKTYVNFYQCEVVVEAECEIDSDW